MFPTSSNNDYPVLSSSNETVDSAQAQANTVANSRSVGESRAGANIAYQSHLDYYDFQDTLYGHMDGPMTPYYSLYDVDLGQNSQL